MTTTATTITVDSLPIAGSIDATQDRFLIYTASALDIQGIPRNTALGLSSQPLGLSDSQSPTNKIFDNTNTLTIKDTNLIIQDDGDTTKQAKFQLSGITTGTTRTYTLPNASGTLADISTSQTFTNKTLTSPVTTAISNSGGATTDSLTVTAATTVGTTLGVTGATTLSSTLAVTGTSTLTGAIGGAGYSLRTMANPYKFFVYRNASYVNVDADPIPFDTKVFDTGTNVDVVTNKGRFTAPIAGFYSFSANLIYSYSSSGNETACYLQKNGSDFIAGTAFVVTYNAADAGEGVAVAAPLVQLAQNDYVTIRGAVGSVGMVTGATPYSSWFSGHLVSAT